jgi:hypothetical protein
MTMFEIALRQGIDGTYTAVDCKTLYNVIKKLSDSGYQVWGRPTIYPQHITRLHILYDGDITRGDFGKKVIDAVEGIGSGLECTVIASHTKLSSVGMLKELLRQLEEERCYKSVLEELTKSSGTNQVTPSAQS